MSELMERYESEKAEKLNPKSDLTKENIVYVICWILFIGILLFLIYVSNHVNGLDITSFNDFIKLIAIITVMLASFRVINKDKFLCDKGNHHVYDK